MAFENAIITKEDDEKYGLTNIFLKYNPSDNVLPDQQYWVIDKERDCWLMESGFFHDSKVDHGYLSKSLRILYYKGEMFEIILENQLYNKIIDHVSYDKVWLLLDVKPITDSSLAIEEIFALLKEILNVYGLGGAWREAHSPSYKVILLDKLERRL